jgi:arylsulfatase A-like enzyme
MKWLLAVLLCLFTVHCLLLTRVYAQAGKANIVTIMVDDLDEASFNQLLNAGKLPNIKKFLIDKGIRFTNSYVSESMCCPSRATFLTGKYSHNTGTYNVAGSETGILGLISKGLATIDQNTGKIPPADWFPSWLSSNNYFNGHIGKFMYITNFSMPPGFDFWRLGLGYDGRPGRYAIADANGNQFYPDVFQTKYYGDRAIDFLNQFPAAGKTNFFLQVAPQTPHVAVPEWVLDNQGGLTSTITDNQIAAYDLWLDHPDPNICERRNLIVKNSNGTYDTYHRDQPTCDQNAWTDWTYVGPESTQYPDTGSLPIVAFSAMWHPDIQGIRQHLIRGDLNHGYTVYTRDLVNDNLAWSVAGTVADLMRDTGSLPVVGYSSTNLMDRTLANGDIGQFLVRGDQANGYHLYTRARLAGQWSAWVQEPDMWDLNTSSEPLLTFTAEWAGSGQVEYQTIRPQTASGQPVIFRTRGRSMYAAIPNNVLGASTAQASANGSPTIFGGEDMWFGNGINQTEASGLDYPHIIWGSRVYPDGSWLNRRSDQSYPLGLYPGGIYPSGSLRADGRDGFIPIPGFDLPNLNAANFNHCAGNLAWICTHWPDLSGPVVGNKTQLDYLKRSHLDRLEAMLSVDVLVGQIFDHLQTQNLLNNTVIIFTSDNGYFQGEHRLGNKMWAYDESIKVPLVIRPPHSNLTDGLSNTNTVVNIDLAATIMDYAGLWNSTYQTKIDGRSLKPLLDSLSSFSPSWRKWFLIEHRYPRFNGQYNPDGWPWWYRIPDFRALRTGDETEDYLGKNNLYVEYTDDPEQTNEEVQTELFNLESDRGETSNLTNNPAYAWKKSAYSSLVANLLSCFGPTCRAADSTSPKPSDLDHDGDTDYLDVLLFLTQPFTANSIFNFNSLIQNFGH